MQVIYTAKYCKFVRLAPEPGEEIGAEVYRLDHIFRRESGFGEAVLGGARGSFCAGFTVAMPTGTRQNIIRNRTIFLKQRG